MPPRLHASLRMFAPALLRAIAGCLELEELAREPRSDPHDIAPLVAGNTPIRRSFPLLVSGEELGFAGEAFREKIHDHAHAGDTREIGVHDQHDIASAQHLWGQPLHGLVAFG